MFEGVIRSGAEELVIHSDVEYFEGVSIEGHDTHWIYFLHFAAGP